MLHFLKIRNFDVSNGSGIRVTVYFTGCCNNCKGCFNPETHDPNAGELFTKETEEYIFELMKKPMISALNLQGGDPFFPQSTQEIYEFLVDFRKKFKNTKDVWVWTGYTIEELYKREDKYTHEILKLIDVLVDGPFILEKKDLRLKWRGSSNQRIFDMKTGKIIED